MPRRMFQSCFLICILFAIGGFVIVGCGKPHEVEIPPNLESFTLDKILRVSDKLPDFSPEDIRDSDYDVMKFEGYNVPPRISFAGQIDLRDGTRYICTDSDKCIIELPNWIITQGTIKVDKPDEILRVNDKFPNFRLEDARGAIVWLAENSEIYNKKVSPHISFKGRIDLRDGTRYICTDSDKCIIGLPNWIITQGTIKVDKPDEAFRVNDKLPDFSPEDIRDSDYDVMKFEGYDVPSRISFKGRIDLQDGTRYICTGSDECIIGLPNWIIIQGTIEVYKKEAGHDLPKN